jgi:hypothetical protein
VLDEGLRSGLFLSGLRRTGKTTFLQNDLIPALQAEGALVIYVDLWSDPQASPAELVRAAIGDTLHDLQKPDSFILRQLARFKGLAMGMAGLSFSFQLESLGAPGGTHLAQALTEVVQQTRTDVVLIIDEVQHAIASEDGGQMLLALKAARDAINPRPDSPGHFIFIGTGSHRAMVNELTTRRNQAFAGATSIAYPLLGEDYVAHLLGRLAQESALPLPSVAATSAAFQALGSRPEELLRALRDLRRHLPQGADPDVHLGVVAQVLRSRSANDELAKVDHLGGLATAIFAYIAGADGHARGLFSADAIARYGKLIGRAVKVEEVQPVVNELLAANLILRRGHGVYDIADPGVQERWQDQQRQVE